MRHFSKLCFLSAIILLFPISLSANSVSDVVISEIMYDFPGTDEKHEWIELYNASNQEIDLTNWKFNDGSSHLLNIPPKNGGQGSIIITAGSYAILAGNATTFLADHPSFSGTVIDTVMSLNNTTATLKLFNKDNNEIVSLAYSKEWGANGNGKSLEKINFETADNQSNWKESSIDGGTPGSPNSVSNETSQGQPLEISSTSTPLSSVPNNQPPKAEAGPDIIALVNQKITFDASKSSDSNNDPLIFSWNFGDGTTSDKITFTHSYRFPGKYIVSLTASDGKNSSTDTLIAAIYSNSVVISEFLPNPEGKDEENEWIELYNNSSQAADLSSWKIDTGENSKAFSFPANTTIAGNQYLVFARPTTKISLNNTSGKVRLIYPTSQISQEIKYEKAAQGQSVNLIKGNEYIWSATPTPGLSNIINNKNNKTAANLNAVIAEAAENNSIPSALIPANPVIVPSPFSQNAINNIPNSQQSANVDNMGINQENKDASAGNNNNNNHSQTQSAAISKLFQNKFSSIITIILIIVFGLGAGLGLAFLRRKIKNH